MGILSSKTDSKIDVADKSKSSSTAPPVVPISSHSRKLIDGTKLPRRLPPLASKDEEKRISIQRKNRTETNKIAVRPALSVPPTTKPEPPKDFKDVEMDYKDVEQSFSDFMIINGQQENNEICSYEEEENHLIIRDSSHYPNNEVEKCEPIIEKYNHILESMKDDNTYGSPEFQFTE